MVQVTVARLGLDSTTGSYVVILREQDGRRLLPIWIGQPEAESIVMEINQVKRPRPLTHDLCKTLIEGLGATLLRVTITGVQKSTYYAEMELDSTTGRVVFDARPSDGIAIALRLDAPIYVADALLADPESEAMLEAPPPDRLPSEHELTPEQLKAYLEKLRPEDFGKFSP
jgi:bifunctional DNase/RNase